MRQLILTLAVLLTAAAVAHADPGQKLPNILWLTTEDIGQELGCYGDPQAVTPNLDKLAQRGIKFRHAWSNAPVCAPARTTLITGVYPPSTGGDNMRSMVAMPEFMRMYPQILRDAGYYVANHTKTDWNLKDNGKVWDSSTAAAWKDRKPGQPFFAIINDTGTHESQIRKRPHTWVHDLAKVRIPAYHPDTVEVREDWAQYYDNITDMDVRMGKIMDDLAAAGAADDTIIFFYGDHGSGMPRSKRWPYNTGLEVAMLLYVPAKWQHLAPKEYKPGTTSERLVSFVDLAPTLVSTAGVKPPDWMQGHAFMGQYQTEYQKYLYGFRGRMDERYDLVRSVTDGRYVYLRQYMPNLIYGQHIAYMFVTPTTQVWKKLFDEGKLNEAQSAFWKTKPAEELYDLTTDRDEVHNLAMSREHWPKLEELRRAHYEHVMAIRDAGFLTEAEQHLRAGDGSVYEMAHDNNRYPLAKIWAMADLASSLKGGVEAQLKAGFKDADSGVRYWAAMGFLMRGAPSVAQAASELQAALHDASPSVRIAAAWALGRHGDAAALAAALDTLKELAPADKNGAYVSLLALNAIDDLGPKADPIKPYLKTIEVVDKNAESRAQKYGGNIIGHILGLKVAESSEGEGKPAAKKAAKKKKK